MNITKTRDNQTVTISVDGRIDSSTAPQLETSVKSEVKDCAKIIFDFKNLSYISSAGLRILLGARKIMGDQGVKIINVSEEVYEVFDITGMSKILDVETI